MDKLPLASVRTFGVVARLLSITRAAEELNVTPSAVSHQIKLLEDYLAARLFTREKNQLRLTPAGELYSSQVSEGLLLLARATQTIRAAKGQQVLRVAAPPSFAVLWLVERLGRFMQEHRDIAIHLTTVPDPAPLLHRAFDIGFSYGGGVIAGLDTDSLGPNHAFPICTPALRAERRLRSPADLPRTSLLDSTDEAYHAYQEPRQPSWDCWLQAARSALNGTRMLNFTPRLVMHQAVVAGLGVGLSRSLLSADALAEKTITVPFGPILPVSLTYHVAYPAHARERKDVVTFRDWIRAEAAESGRKLERLLRPHMQN